MKHPNRLTVECTETERGGCEGPAMFALLAMICILAGLWRLL